MLEFLEILAESNEKILTGAPGGPEMYTTQTVDFIRFTYKGFIHVLYGTGGHTTPITDYYRVYVLRNANRILCMFDLSGDLEQQLAFYENLDIPPRQITIYLNKYDLAADNYSEYKEQIEDFFINKKKKLIKELLPTVAAKVEGDEYKKETKNCIKGILDLCEFDKDSSAFNVWDGQGR